MLIYFQLFVITIFLFFYINKLNYKNYYLYKKKKKIIFRNSKLLSLKLNSANLGKINIEYSCKVSKNSINHYRFCIFFINKAKNILQNISLIKDYYYLNNKVTNYIINNIKNLPNNRVIEFIYGINFNKKSKKVYINNNGILKSIESYKNKTKERIYINDKNVSSCKQNIFNVYPKKFLNVFLKYFPFSSWNFCFKRNDDIINIMGIQNINIDSLHIYIQKKKK